MSVNETTIAAERDLRVQRRLADEPFDLVVVGGGIHGAFATWKAARWGWRVALLERDDFGSGTSANSLKIAHGGLRYLQTADLARLRASVRERAALRRLAPALVRPLPCVLPTSGTGMHSRAALAAALFANEVLSLGVRGSVDVRLPRGRTMGRREYRELAGRLAVPSASGAALWYDALIESPERLLLSLVLAAEREGAAVLNHAEVLEVLGSDGRVTGVRMRRRAPHVGPGGMGATLDVRASAVLVTAGPWVARLVDGNAQPLVRACNLVVRVPPDRLPEVAAALPLARERRMLFAVPWGERLMLGTSYVALPAGVVPERAIADAEGDVALLLDDVRRAAPALELRREDVTFVHVGLLPGEARAHGAAPFDRPAVVDHGAADGLAGLVSVQGVKWTTARRVARQALELCALSAGLPRPVPRPDEPDGAAGPVLVPEADGADLASRVALLPGRAERGSGQAGRIAARLTRLRGAAAGEVLALAASEPQLAEPLPGSEILAAEVVLAVRREHARTLADLVFRRLELGTAGAPDPATLDAVATLAAAELGWDDARRARERARVLARYALAAGGRPVPDEG